MTRPLDTDFPLRSPLAVRPPRDVTLEEQRLGLESEMARRQRTYPGYVQRGTMTQADATLQLQLCQHMLDDVVWLEWSHATAAAEWRGEAPPPRPRRHADTATWEDCVRELRRDLAIRRNAYPRWIASATNPLTVAEAAATLEWLDAVHYRYWTGLDGFTSIDIIPMHDHARVAWIADAECQYQQRAWNAALGAGGVRRRRLATRDRAFWQRLASLGRAFAGGTALAARIGQTALDRLLNDSEQIWRATIDTTNAGDRPAYILDWHLSVDRWLQARRHELSFCGKVRT